MNSDQKLLSLIIPVYNAEKYLKECLQSVFNQSDNGLEVIIINDGSIDTSRDIITSFGSLYDFIIIDKHNGGVASARNVGIERATAEYITFLDSDDIWCNGVYEKIKEIICSSEDHDCLVFDYYNFYSEHQIEPIKQEDTKSSGENIKIDIATLSHWYLWRFIFKSKFYRENKFIEGRRFEDQLILPKLINSANKIKKTNLEIVFYRKNIDSITNNLKISDLDDNEYCIDRYLVEFYKKPCKYWSIVLANLYLSHVSKCARIYHQNSKMAIDSYKRVNKSILLKIIIDSGNRNALFYYCSLGLLFRRLIKRVKTESI
ncbi:glycosyltransferase [Vibrio sp. 1151_11]|uniref:glycosyltransferase family 2 protein n=1 Tax=Vibrio sp. 1151_11 TaxID=2527670 RepID=UPI0024055143|nr:glycosyltransferase [Vibrio sp. 1151_11]MDF9388209.1 glycosyltransferase [Vibrio sp. 1151_11]